MIQAENSGCPDSLGALGANEAGTGLKSGTPLTRVGSPHVRKTEMQCEGFTRPQCLPCPYLTDIKVTYYNMYGKQFKPLCVRCEKLLLKEPMGWGSLD
jgi:hypothetical protein